MSLPNILFGTSIAILFGTIFHLIRGGNYKKLLLYIFLSIVGFWISNLIGLLLAWEFGKLGQLHVILGSMGSILVLLLDLLAQKLLNPNSNSA